MKIGDPVKHKSFGLGRIVDKWGSWPSCRECNDQTPEPSLIWCFCCDHPVKTSVIPDSPPLYRCLECLLILGHGRPNYAFCPTCYAWREVRRISGVGVFIVEFGHEQIPVHKHWLRVQRKIIVIHEGDLKVA